MTALDFYYAKRDCPECVGYQKNCDHFWAGHVVGREVGRLREQERILKLLDVVEYPYGNETKFQTLADAVFEGEMLFGDFRLELIALIKGANE